MRNFLPPTEFFREKKIEIFFLEKQKKIVDEIKSYSESSINKINFEEEADNIIKRSNFKVPKLIKEGTTTGISTLILSGRQLPPGRFYQQGRNYEVEVADYGVPFEGNKDFFKIYPSKYHSKNVEAVLNTNGLVFRLTNYGKITGNETEIENLKREFLANIDATEKTLLQIEKELTDYLPKLRALIIQSLENRKQFLNSKKDSTDKLNPFN
ncbi:hypothetical protein [Chryseobacterium turcicum]|uniref:Uncharacterized protein n=1 Tax=Chryseobacterium turcicum TaxID=2898076 RepID=A0A9Q3V1L0_9FLAO|nr:hypothetical protein [Chryseobacterium turcicum]MCD1117888.1 hypothetical protein [Chryseobacterium turcicum]